MRYQFLDFTLDTACFELRKAGALIHTEPQVLELLALLVEHRDRLVTKEEINEKIWKGRVVSEAALSSRVKTARQVVGDDGRAQLVIKTIHKRGFRFVARVDGVVVDDSGDDMIKQRPLTGNGAELVSAAKPAVKPAVGILPFANFSQYDGQDYLADGITTDIIARLSKHRWLNVTARNTSFGFKGKTVDVRALGKVLNVNYVVEGTVQRAGNRIRVNASLIDTSSGHQKWAERFDRDLDDIFELQDAITETIVARLEPEIGFSERDKVVHNRPANLQAWDCYHLGVYHFFKFTGPDNLEAQKLLRQCQTLDNDFGEAHAWWAYAAILGMVYWQTQPTAALLDEALSACNKALSIDRQNATFYALRARVLLARQEYALAIIDNKKAISLNPTLAVAHCGLGDSLAYEGRYDESLTSFDRAIALSPNDPQLWAFYTYGALVLIFKEDFETALLWVERASGIPNYQYWTTAHKVVTLAYLGRHAALKKAKAQMRNECPGFCQAFVREKLFYLKMPEQVALYMHGLEMAGVE
jgi:adenylate cyclase